MSENCVFCQIINKEIPAEFIKETENLVCFKDINPSAEAHLLIVPKAHLATFLDLNTNDLLGEMFLLARELISELKLEKQYKLVINGGTNQIVPHFHLHLLGGKMKGNV